MSGTLDESRVSVKRFVLHFYHSKPQKPTLTCRRRQKVKQVGERLHLLGAHNHEAGFAFVRQDRLDVEGAAIEYQAVGGGEVGAIAHGNAVADRVLHLGGGEVFLPSSG